MEKLSRVKKYEELRKNIETQHGEDDTGNKLTPFANRLNGINPSLFKKVPISDDIPYVPERERREAYVEEETKAPTNNFKNEYMDDFINEVREYNIKKGNREDMDTQIDILHQLNNVNREKRSHYVEDIQEDLDEPASLTKNEIASQIQSLLNESNHENKEAVEHDRIQALSMEQEETNLQPIIENEVKPILHNLEEETLSIKKISDTQTSQVKEIHHQLIEETQQLRVQMGEYEGEINDLNDGLDHTNKTLNLILFLLIFSLIVVIGIIIFYIFKTGGMF
ncbi:MAG: hypothetical protein RSF69_02105 [Erysipelotrichaceae bacterium]